MKWNVCVVFWSGLLAVDIELSHVKLYWALQMSSWLVHHNVQLPHYSYVHAGHTNVHAALMHVHVACTYANNHKSMASMYAICLQCMLGNTTSCVTSRSPTQEKKQCYNEISVRTERWITWAVWNEVFLWNSWKKFSVQVDAHVACGEFDKNRRHVTRKQDIYLQMKSNRLYNCRHVHTFVVVVKFTSCSQKVPRLSPVLSSVKWS